jgi:valyl-tRNA synthetase
MSKSKGNVIDPLEVVDDLGADPLRFTMAILSGTRDIKVSRQRIEGYRNFGTKLWNAARFAQMNGCAVDPAFDPGSAKLTLNRWIRGEAVKASQQVTEALEKAHFDEAASALYRFVWNVFCDWHLELAKPVLNGADEAAKAETRAMTAWVLDQALKLLHPITPFVTEELWQALGEEAGGRDGMLITAPWPDLPEGWIDAEAQAEIGWLIELVSQIRSIRSEMNVPPSAKPGLTVSAAAPGTLERLDRYRALLLTLARLQSADPADTAPKGAAPFVVGEATYALGIADFIDLAAERARLAKEIGVLGGDIERASKKLGNPDYVSRAPEHVVEETREKLVEAEAARDKLAAALKRLEAVA